MGAVKDMELQARESFERLVYGYFDAVGGSDSAACRLLVEIALEADLALVPRWDSERGCYVLEHNGGRALLRVGEVNGLLLEFVQDASVQPQYRVAAQALMSSEDAYAGFYSELCEGLGLLDGEFVNEFCAWVVDTRGE